MSQGALAKAAGLTASEISRIECGYCDLSPKHAAAIAKAFGVPVREVEDDSRAGAVPAAPETAEPRSAPRPVVEAAPVARSVATVEAEPVRAVGNDLNDPANFRELPDLGLLERGSLDVEAFRTRLRGALERATKILHTSQVPAAVWRAWRDFERRGNEALRTAGDSVVTETASPLPGAAGGRGAAPATANDTLVAAEQALRTKRTSKARHREKSFNALFFDAAQAVLPTEVAARLTGIAEHRIRNNRSLGFIRCFREVAGELLAADALARIAAAITAKEQGRGRGRYAGGPAVSSFNLHSGSRTSGGR